MIMSHHSEYKNWPFLNQEEFEEACTLFDQKYVQAHLGPTRQVFKIRQRRIATTGSSYIEIQRLLTLPEDDDELTLAFGKMVAAENQTEDIAQDVSIDEDTDMEALPPQYSEFPHQPYVKYEIHLHPTYQTPCLWFELKDLPMGESNFDIDSVYRYLIPDHEKSRMREVGVKGGISFDHHPVTEVPAFFIHPCMTQEAMGPFNVPIEEYLMCWLGLVGPAVGLWMPLEMSENSN